MHESEKVSPATLEEINAFLEEENHKKSQEIKDLKAKVNDVETEMFRYRTAFRMLVKELSNKR